MKAIGLLSGGLDSALAVKVILEQGIEVEALKFTSIFCQCDHGGKCFSADLATELGIPYKTIAKGEEYLDIVRNPQFGYGSGVNPCIDCRIYILKKAKEYADKQGAAFVFTGEVLGQRPMSQHMKSLKIIEKESGLEGKLLRPLSAKFLDETEAEKNGWVDRDKLFRISGRSRKPQMELAENLGVTTHSCPAGGCLLTDKTFAAKARDHFAHDASFTMKDAMTLKTGRHFRINDSKIIAGRRQDENATLKSLKREDDIIIETIDVKGPVVLLRGKTSASYSAALEIIAAYSDADSGEIQVTVTTGDSIVSASASVVDRSVYAPYLIQANE